MSTEANKAVVHRYLEVYNQANTDAVDELFIGDMLCHVSGMSEPLTGLEANKEMLAGFLAGFSEIQFTAEDMLAEGDRVAARLSWRLKHTGPYAGISPTGHVVQGNSIEIYRFENGRIAEVWTALDNMSFMQQLGALPAME
jgi:steroid delta-isomerase-like uncharacterized protein